MVKKAMLEKVSIDLTPLNIRKLRKGEKTQLKHHQLCGTGTSHIFVVSSKARKMRTHHKNKKGMRLHLSPEELDKTQGEGFFEDLGKTIKEGIKKAGPSIRKVLTDVIRIGAPELAIATGNPELAIPASITAETLGKKVVDKIGDTLGFGVKSTQHAQKKKGRKLYPKEDLSQFNGTWSPAMNPALPLPDFSRPNYKTGDTSLLMKGLSGGSFLPSGQQYYSGAGMTNPALNPVLPFQDFSRPNYHTGDRFFLKGGSFMTAGSGRRRSCKK